MVIRLGGIAARKRPIGKNAARAFRKSLKPESLKFQIQTLCILASSTGVIKALIRIYKADSLKTFEF